MLQMHEIRQERHSEAAPKRRAALEQGAPWGLKNMAAQAQGALVLGAAGALSGAPVEEAPHQS